MAPARPAANWFGQPPGLTILFLTQMWEEFSFFGMRALLVYYMTKQLGFAQGDASLVYGAYTAFVYLTPIAGGWIADRWLSRRSAIVLGGSIMALGHFMMASPALFYPALVTIAVGNGFFLPTLPSQIGSLYQADDPRRGSAYNVYYVGINLGAFMAPLGCGALGEAFGWHYGFALAGVGMVVGLLTYLAGARYLPPEPPRVRRATADPAGAGGATGRLGLLLAVGLCVVVFRGAYEQIGNTLALWTDEQVDRTLAGGLSIPRTWFQSVNPLVVFLLTPAIVAHWTRQAKAGREPSSAAKMALGAGGVAAAYVLLAIVCVVIGPHGQAPWPLLVGFLVLFTASELFILPVGLGLFARLAPASLAATTVAAWYSAAFAGNLLAGALGTLWSRLPHAGFFGLMAAIGALSAGLLALLTRRAQTVEAAGATALSAQAVLPI